MGPPRGSKRLPRRSHPRHRPASRRPRPPVPRRLAMRAYRTGVGGSSPRPRSSASGSRAAPRSTAQADRSRSRSDASAGSPREPGLEVHPSLSPDGKFLAFAAGPTGRLRVYVRQLAGGRTIAVAEDLGGDQHWPRWSPDGTRLSLETNRSIYVVPALGGAPKLLVAAASGPVLNGEGALSEEGPSYLAWSPDGRRIAYAMGPRHRRSGGGRRASHPPCHDGPAALLRLVARREPARVRGGERRLRVRA